MEASIIPYVPSFFSFLFFPSFLLFFLLKKETKAVWSESIALFLFLFLSHSFSYAHSSMHCVLMVDGYLSLLCYYFCLGEKQRGLGRKKEMNVKVFFLYVQFLLILFH